MSLDTSSSIEIEGVLACERCGSLTSELFNTLTKWFSRAFGTEWLLDTVPIVVSGVFKAGIVDVKW